ncbi:unnamed protein product [Didymodactylos carnosus]|uniref:PPM-type phosphatase domain-containing protein n=1 Tax=Didymodactylos carnosus TaxID=1234261 RepID=A0A813PDT5_9BILA|nr:unnamed protein product [Didymodactylos carnosus]CAF0749696.1 unnamed protein product [Didymodactylos carnosus]CAF3519273.1 unnamed protein product [Didymodactylos carnosus]CAF3529028.1 unnamed protein product [Didymodactylos carnosus]
MEDTYAIALQRLNSNDKESPISLAYFGIFDGHGGKEAAEFARQNLCQRILEQDDFWPISTPSTVTNNEMTSETTVTSEKEIDDKILSAIRKGFLQCHSDMWNDLPKWTKTSSGLPSTSGCTASVVFVRGNKLYIGHVGDSAIVLGIGDSLYKPWQCTRLTKDHKPEDPSELKRIRDSGGNVLCKAGVHRVVWNRPKVSHSHHHHHRHSHHSHHSHRITTVNSQVQSTTAEYEQIPFLAVSRALGDLWSFNSQTNLYSVSPEPELAVIEINPLKHRCLILASDGLWNMMTPEDAVEIVRSCDVKTEEMILKAEDDDQRPFRNPSHELVQKSLTCWRERMLRADNVTCVTVMLDQPGPPFSDCIVMKKKQFNHCSVSSSTASVYSDDTVDIESGTMFSTPPKHTNDKPVLHRTASKHSENHILIPISNGQQSATTPLRTPKRPASDDGSSILQNTPRRKLIKTNQKENGSQRLNGETEINDVGSSDVASVTDINDDDYDETNSEIQPSQKESTSADDNDLEMKVDECSRDTEAINMNGDDDEEQQQKMDIDEPITEKMTLSSQDSTKRCSSRRSKFLFSSSNDTHPSKAFSSSSDSSQQSPQCLRRTRSASMNTSMTRDDDQRSVSTRRRKSCSVSNIRTDNVIVRKTISLTTKPSRTQSSIRKPSSDTPTRQRTEKKSSSTLLSNYSSSKIKPLIHSSSTSTSASTATVTTRQTFASRVKRAFLRPHRASTQRRPISTNNESPRSTKILTSTTTTSKLNSNQNKTMIV